MRCSKLLFSAPSFVMKTPVIISTQKQARDLIDSIDCILTDCDGVLYRSDGPIAGSVGAMAKLRQLGKKVFFVTNNSTVSRIKATAKLNGFGFEAAINDVFPTSVAVADYLKRLNFQRKVFVCGCDGIREELNNASIRHLGGETELIPTVIAPDVDIDPEVDAVVIGYDNKLTIPKLIKVCTYASKVQDHLFVASEPDESIVRANGQILPLAGSTISFVRTAIRRDPVILGKPMSHLFQSVRDAHPELDPSRALMIGDRLNTDIAFGNNNHVEYTLLVETGENKLKDAQKASQTVGREHEVPSHCAPSLATLTEFL